jgi:hypothetical protein
MSIFREIKMAASRLCLENLQTYETSDLPEVDQVTFTSRTFHQCWELLTETFTPLSFLVTGTQNSGKFKLLKIQRLTNNLKCLTY